VFIEREVDLMSTGFREIDNKTLKKLQKVQIEILDEIDRICKKNDIEYFLVGGTLLGAIRHKGFIPWDDDLDIGMVRKDYEKFIDVCFKDLDSKYFLDCSLTTKDSHLSFAKVRKNNTTFDEEAISKLDVHKGIYVDIFPLDRESSNLKKCFIKGFFVRNLIETVFYKKKIYNIDNCRHPFFVKIFKHLSYENIYKLEKGIATSYRGKNKTHLVSYYGAYSIRKEFFDYNMFFPLKMVEFHGKMYPSPNDSDKYLTSLYGDYMTLPPVEKRVNHSALYISFDEGKNIVLGDKNEN